MIETINLKNRDIMAILNATTTKDLFGNSFSKSKGFETEEYDIMSEYAVSPSYLQKRLETKSPKIELAHNLIIGESEGGKYFLENLKNLEFTNYYTSGYSPKGFVGWHSDTDIPGWYIMLSYSTEGEGFFRYLDNGEIITLPDSKGWMIRTFKLGETDEDVVWHCASTTCTRYTFLLHFDSVDGFTQALNKL